MQALGFIETRGLVAAIESADAMLKAAEVHLVERTFVKGGIVTITVTGDIAACKASVDAAAAAVTRMGGTILSTHVIPRPHESLDGLVIGPAAPGKEVKEDPDDKEIPDKGSEAEEVEEVEPESLEPDTVAKKLEANRASVEGMIETEGIDRAISLLKRFKIAELKEMICSEYTEINLDSEAVMNLTKKELLDWLKDFYIKS